MRRSTALTSFDVQRRCGGGQRPFKSHLESTWPPESSLLERREVTYPIATNRETEFPPKTRRICRCKLHHELRHYRHFESPPSRIASEEQNIRYALEGSPSCANGGSPGPRTQDGDAQHTGRHHLGAALSRVHSLSTFGLLRGHLHGVAVG